MPKTRKKAVIWKACSRFNSAYEFEGMLMAYWEVYLDPISDDYTPQEINAWELFHKWEEQVRQKFPNGLIPIFWFVHCEEHGIFECMPFQFEHIEGSCRENFLTFFTWPVNSKTGQPLNWLTLPVVDKFWNHKRADKGGFIQEATGWKPAILQPYVYLPALSSALRK